MNFGASLMTWCRIGIIVSVGMHCLMTLNTISCPCFSMPANNENRKFVEVKKNRYDGTLGICPLHFNFDSKRYSETPVAQLSSQKKVARPAAVPPRVIPMTAGGRTFVSAASIKTKVGPAAPSTKPASTNMDLTYSSILED